MCIFDFKFINKYKKYSYSIFFLILLVGVVLRFYHLGNLGIIENEDYVVIAAKSILKNWIPLFPSEMVYPRAVPFSYIVAAMIKLFGFSEFIIRVPSVVFSVLLIGVTYLLGKELIGHSGGLIAAFLMSVSDWEIQTAQTARMYSMFSFFFMLSIYLMYKVITQDMKRLKFLVIVCSVFTCLLHQLAGILVIIYGIFTIIYWKAGKRNFIVLVLVLTLFATLGYKYYENYNYNISKACVVQQLGDNKNYLEVMNVNHNINKEMKQNIFRLFLNIKEDKFYFILLNVGFFITLVGGISYFLKTCRDMCFIPCFVLIIISLYLQQAMLSVLVFLAYLYFKGEGFKGLIRKEGFFLLVVIGFAMIFWLCVSFFSMWGEGTKQGMWLNLIGSGFLPSVKPLFMYPSNFFKIYLIKYPVMSAFVLFGGILIFHRSSIDKTNKKEMYLFFSFIITLLSISFHPLSIIRAYERYAFFLNPLFTLLFAYSILFCINKIKNSLETTGAPNKLSIMVKIIFVVLIFITTDFFNIKSSYAWLNRKYGVNKNVIEKIKEDFLFYPDHKGPAEYIKREWKSGDIVIAMDILPLYAYFPKVDYQLDVNYSGNAEGFLAAKTIGTVDELSHVLKIHKGDRVWIILAGKKKYHIGKSSRHTKMMNMLDCFKSQIKYIGRDDLSIVLLFDQNT
jgi:4-amino-4-deoxy-L-arabinose transferase-like glycosyltransferase